MRPQTLNNEQQEQLDAAKRALRRYKMGLAVNASASAELTERIAGAVDAGVTRYKVAKELGMTPQAVDGRLSRRQAPDQAE